MNDTQNSQYVTIYVLVNWPRLRLGFDEPLEALIRDTNDQHIIHNLFGKDPEELWYISLKWIKKNGYGVIEHHVVMYPEVELYNAARRLGRSQSV